MVVVVAGDKGNSEDKGQAQQSWRALTAEATNKMNAVALKERTVKEKVTEPERERPNELNARLLQALVQRQQQRLRWIWQAHASHDHVLLIPLAAAVAVIAFVFVFDHCMPRHSGNSRCHTESARASQQKQQSKGRCVDRKTELVVDRAQRRGSDQMNELVVFVMVCAFAFAFERVKQDQKARDRVLVFVRSTTTPFQLNRQTLRQAQTEAQAQRQRQTQRQTQSAALLSQAQRQRQHRMPALHPPQGFVFDQGPLLFALCVSARVRVYAYARLRMKQTQASLVVLYSQRSFVLSNRPLFPIRVCGCAQTRTHQRQRLKPLLSF